MNTNIEALLGHHFENESLLLEALTHSSFHFENREQSTGHFERLEFLGDAVLDLVMSEVLMHEFPDANEGTLSKWRASLVNETQLAELARAISLEQSLRLGKSEAGQRGNLRPRLLASGFEALIGALYLDSGIEKAREFLKKQFASRLENLDQENFFAADFKTRLQEWSQKSMRLVPEYRLVSSSGPEHAKVFEYEVYVNERLLGEGRGNSRKSAEQDAARNALEKMNEL